MQHVSIVVPVKDEQDTIREMVAEVEASFAGIDAGTATLEEIIFVDDGSRDGSWAEITSLSEAKPRIKGVRLRRNFGKAADPPPMNGSALSYGLTMKEDHDEQQATQA